MAYEQKDKSGSLFPNDKKGNDKAPDKSKEGKPYMSLKVSEPQAKEDDGMPF